jgi:hypothetical protein
VQEALGRCAASIESSAQEVLMLRDEMAAAAAASADGAATSDLQDLKLLSSAQARLSNIVQASSIHFNHRVHRFNIRQILTQSEQLQTKMQQLEHAVAQGSLQHVADTACQCRSLLSELDNLPALHLMRARIDEATLSTPSPQPLPSTTPDLHPTSIIMKSPHLLCSEPLFLLRHTRSSEQRLESLVHGRGRGHWQDCS